MAVPVNRHALAADGNGLTAICLELDDITIPGGVDGLLQGAVFGTSDLGRHCLLGVDNQLAKVADADLHPAGAGVQAAASEPLPGTIVGNVHDLPRIQARRQRQTNRELLAVQVAVGNFNPLSLLGPIHLDSGHRRYLIGNSRIATREACAGGSYSNADLHHYCVPRII